MKHAKTVFTPRLLLSGPRRSHGVPNPSGTTVLFTTTSYSFQEHSQNTTLRALLVQSGEIIDVAVNQIISHVNWLDDERFVCLRSEKDGRTSLLHAAFGATINNSNEPTSLRSAGIINASVIGMKISRLDRDCDDFAVVISAPACRNGKDKLDWQAVRQFVCAALGPLRRSGQKLIVVRQALFGMRGLLRAVASHQPA